VRLVHHDSSRAEDLAPIGVLSGSGRRLRLNRRAVGAELLVVTGAITFHYHAGFTGGRKAVLPGLASRADVLANHARTLSEGSTGGRDPRCRPGGLDGNPVHEEMEAAARLLTERLVERTGRPPFLVNTVMAEGGGLAAVFAGDLFAAFRRGTEYVDRHFRAPFGRPFDLAVASAGGDPRDRTFYQAHKAFDHASRAVRDGGAVVLAAACPDGAGPGFLDWCGHLGYEEHLAELQERFAVPGQTALALKQKLGRTSGVLLSRMRADEVRRMGLVPARTLGEAISRARKLLGGGGTERVRGCLIPHASTTLPCAGGGGGGRRRRKGPGA
jgi:nickel-dependent lactate racemase